MTGTDSAYTTTRLAWQALGEHILSKARYDATGRIGLRRAEGGIGTPVMPSDHGDRRLLIQGAELVDIDDRGERRETVTTLGAAAAFVVIEAGAPTDVYTPTTPLDLDAPLMIDATEAARLAAFYAAVDDALAQLREAHAAAAETQLWPEHFDLASTIDEVNVGGSPGDADHVEPYLYVGPWAPRTGDFWNESWGASTTFTDATTVADALAFFQEGLRHAADDPRAE